MEDILVGNILAVALFLVALFICARAFYTYAKLKSPRLFTLGLAMGVVALTAAADFTSSNFPSLGLNTDWFLFIGQAVSFLFIWLSLLSHADDYLHWLYLRTRERRGSARRGPIKCLLKRFDLW